MRLFGMPRHLKMLHDLNFPEGRKERCFVLFQPFVVLFQLIVGFWYQLRADFDQSVYVVSIPLQCSKCSRSSPRRLPYPIDPLHGTKDLV